MRRSPKRNRRNQTMLIADTKLSVITRKPLSGGCISKVEHLKCLEGDFVYKKYTKPGISQAESEGLRCIEMTHTIRVPSVVSVSDTELLMTYIKPNNSFNTSSELGKSLAKLHLCGTKKQFGFYCDNWLGETVQKNSWKEHWVDFFIENRYLFQIELLKKRGLLSSVLEEMSQKVLKQIPSLLENSSEQPRLIHGDLWSGNYFCDSKGNAVIIDPAISYSHREMELGMLELFGNIDVEFYDVYEEIFPLKTGWKKRVKLYTLYHLLNHLNLFGKTYENDCIRVMNSIITGNE